METIEILCNCEGCGGSGQAYSFSQGSYPCPDCDATGKRVLAISGDLFDRLKDLEDKIDDVIDKCNDIFTAVSS